MLSFRRTLLSFGRSFHLKNQFTTTSTTLKASVASRTFSSDPRFDSVDHYFKDDRLSVSDRNRRSFVYFILGGGRAITAVFAKVIVVQFVAAIAASAEVLALASAEFDLSEINEGQTITVKWRGKPIFIRHRTAEDISDCESVSLADLKDPKADGDRIIDPQWLVVLGVCTHLGCVPIPDAGDFIGGFFCPCHGSHYDGSGRIRKGPAPLNLEVPPYKFIDERTILIG